MTEQGKPEGGFARISERVVADGWLIKLYRSVFSAPDGATFERDVIRHPGAVAVVPLTNNGTAVLVRQYRGAVDRWMLEIPAGTRDVDGEPTHETAARELEEEVGLKAATLTSLGTFFNSPGYSDQQTEIFVATGLEKCATDRHGPEEDEMTIEEISLADVLVKQQSGEITDAQTIIGLLLAQKHLAATDSQAGERSS